MNEGIWGETSFQLSSHLLWCFSFLFPPNLHKLFSGSSLPSSPFFHDRRWKGSPCRTRSRNRSAPRGPCLPGAPRNATALLRGSDCRRRAGGRRGGALCKAPFAEGLRPSCGEPVQVAGRRPVLAPRQKPQGQRAGPCRRRPLHSPSLGWPAASGLHPRSASAWGPPAFSSVPFSVSSSVVAVSLPSCLT